MTFILTVTLNRLVSLFTREWIEIEEDVWKTLNKRKSPSLRGSGLKYAFIFSRQISPIVSLFTREWIEITILSEYEKKLASPSLRGSGLKSDVALKISYLTGSVSLFTREWIEITIVKSIWLRFNGLPLYEGVD